MTGFVVYGQIFSSVCLYLMQYLTNFWSLLSTCTHILKRQFAELFAPPSSEGSYNGHFFILNITVTDTQKFRFSFIFFFFGK